MNLNIAAGPLKKKKKKRKNESLEQPEQRFVSKNKRNDFHYVFRHIVCPAIKAEEYSHLFISVQASGEEQTVRGDKTKDEIFIITAGKTNVFW